MQNFPQDRQKDATDNGAGHGADPPDHDIDEYLKAQQIVGLFGHQSSHIGGEKSTGQTCEKGADGKTDNFAPHRIDTHRLSQILIAANGDQLFTGKRFNQTGFDQDGDKNKKEDKIITGWCGLERDHTPKGQTNRVGARQAEQTPRTAGEAIPAGNQVIDGDP